ncbi:histidinol-phosphate aminotransferase 2 [Devosia yakushimensis]|uniref:Histidinol-phosphate aminotransferase n=1 Tax=Devosia yakushimensis TaxID=470028 RepID=A0ABQ5UHS2_9HYPH|nr:histidinol-phosphate transaminase [Devosia yakushimensis]GLQ11640.1 histidinol-phosphate aminotransferase 2 [Devosia yakushimensis]
MSQFWSPIVQSLRPYMAGEQPAISGLIKLNTNENPYGPSPKALAAIAAATDDTLRLYPDPSALRLRQAIAARHGLDVGDVFAGNGSDEVLAHVFQGLLNHDAPLLFPDVTYSFYPTYCRLYGIDFRAVPVDENLQVRIADYGQDCGAIILPNPNGPTGIARPLSEIEALIGGHPDRPVVIDEAYVDFGGESAVPLIKKYPNLLVVQTFSKSRGLAGLRVGFAMGQRPLIEALERVKDSFNSYPLNRLALAGAVASWEDEDWFERHRALLMASRERLALELKGLGFVVLESAANFVFARHPGRDGAALALALRSRAILVRHFPAERTRDFLRISIGTDAECDRLVEALREILG